MIVEAWLETGRPDAKNIFGRHIGQLSQKVAHSFDLLPPNRQVLVHQIAARHTFHGDLVAPVVQLLDHCVVVVVVFDKERAPNGALFGFQLL